MIQRANNTANLLAINACVRISATKFIMEKNMKTGLRYHLILFATDIAIDMEANIITN